LPEGRIVSSIIATLRAILARLSLTLSGALQKWVAYNLFQNHVSQRPLLHRP